MRRGQHIVFSTLLVTVAAFVPIGHVAAESPSRQAVFTFDLSKAAVTSAGVYDASDRLISVLWEMKQLPRGTSQGAWNGKDGYGNDMPAGTYKFRVVANRSIYRNIGVIGNTGANTFGHIPTNFECLALGQDGFLYSVHDWNEPHHKVIMWDTSTGQVHAHSGNAIRDIPKAVCVDNEFAYVTARSNHNPNDPEMRRSRVRFTITRLRIGKTKGERRWQIAPFTQAGDEITVYSGNASYPDDSSQDARALMTVPLLSIAVNDDRLYVTDSLAGKVRIYDKVTGVETGSFAVELPQSIEVAPDGRIWVGHARHKVSVFAADGRYVATPIDDLLDLEAVTISTNGVLGIADRGAGQVKLYLMDGDRLTELQTLGHKAGAGDPSADRFHELRALAIDPEGNVYTAQTERAQRGGRLAKFNRAGTAVWEQLGLEFSSCATYSADEPDALYSSYRHNYTLNKRDGSWTYIGNNTPDPAPYWRPSGHARILNIDGEKFYVASMGDGVQSYRIEKSSVPGFGPELKLAAVLGRADPLPDARRGEPWRPESRFLWSWRDDTGDAAPQRDEIRFAAKPGDGQSLWQYGALTVDADGNIWMGSYDRGGNTPERESIWMIPMKGVNARGNPVYDWQSARCAVTREQLIPAEMLTASHADPTVQPKLVHRADDGLLYFYARCNWPDAPRLGGLHMGGNFLAALDGEEYKWNRVLPETCVGLAAIPGGHGGCVVGGRPRHGIVHHYSREGLRIGAFGPDPKVMGEPPNVTSGALDMFHAINVCRDPRDGLLDVFVEDNYNLRIAWYRIDDRDISTVNGVLQLD